MVSPDDEARLASYGEIGKTIEVIGQGLASQAGDPTEVADAIVALVKAPAGSRPLRTLVPAGSPVEAINAATAPIQHGILDAFGLGAFLPPEVAAVH
jgi:hypothetical protein